MSTYKAIKGQNIRVVSSDPSNLVLGDVWYNSTTNLVKAYAQQASWSLTGDISAGRCMSFVGGTKDAGWIAGGRPGNQTVSQDWDGTSFAVGNSLNTGSNSGGKAGLFNSGLRAGGNGGGLTSEEYDGATWTAGGTMNTARRDLAAGVMGTQTAGLAVAGRIGGTATNAIEEYNGSSWTSVTNYPTTLRAGGGAGTQISTLVCGGQVTSGSGPTNTVASNSYDGTNWTASANLGTAVYFNLSSGADATASITSGGWQPASTAATEEFSEATVEAQTLTTS